VAGKKSGTEVHRAAPTANRGDSGRRRLARAAGELMRFFIAAVPWGGSHDHHARQGMGTGRRRTAATPVVRRRGGTRGASGVGEKGGGRAAQRPCAYRVEPVGPRRLRRAHGAGSTALARAPVADSALCAAELRWVGLEIWFTVFQLSFTQNFETQVGQVLNSKVVDQLTLYHFYEGRIGF
jgi:hypothetical protein